MASSRTCVPRLRATRVLSASQDSRRGTEAFISLEALLCQTAVQHYQHVQHSERVPRCFRLAAAGQLEALRAALEEDASDIDSAFLCITPVAAAALFGHADCMELLLSKGARPEPSEYHRPILYACLKGHYACVRLLLAAGATAGLLESESDTDSEDEDSLTVPERVRCQSATEMWDLDSWQLAKDFADLGVEGAAALSQLEEFFDSLHAQWSGFCARHRWRKPRWRCANCKECFSDARTLYAHIDRRQCQKVGRLRDLVMPLDTRHSPLQCAAEVDSVECVEVLLTAGAAELEPFLERGHWALLTACQHGSVRSAAKIIAETPASLSVRTKKGATPLMQACLCGQVTIVRLLLDFPEVAATVNYMDDQGLSAVRLAADPEFEQLTGEERRRRIECVLELVAAGASLDCVVVSRLGLPPCARFWDNTDILRFFERRVAVCMLHHGRLGNESMWSGLYEGILRMVLSYETT